MDCGRGQWQDVDPTWVEPLEYALLNGAQEARCPTQSWQDGKNTTVWYTIDLSDPTCITQTKVDGSKTREMRVVQLKRPNVAQGRAMQQ